MASRDFEQMIIFLYVSDLNRSKDFYEGIMKFPLRLDQGTCRIVETNQKGGGLLGYCSKDPSKSIGNQFIITLVTPDVDVWYDYLKENGVEVLEPPQFNPGFNIYHFYFKDPDGHLLEIQEFRDPAWNR